MVVKVRASTSWKRKSDRRRPLGSFRVDVYDAEAFGVVFFAEVDSLEAAGVGHEGVVS